MRELMGLAILASVAMANATWGADTDRPDVGILQEHACDHTA